MNKVSFGWNNDKTRKKTPDVKNLPLLYPLVHLKATVPRSPEVIRCSIQRRTVVLMPHRSHSARVDVFVMEDHIEGAHRFFSEL